MLACRWVVGGCQCCRVCSRNGKHSPQLTLHVHTFGARKFKMSTKLWGTGCSSISNLMRANENLVTTSLFLKNPCLHGMHTNARRATARRMYPRALCVPSWLGIVMCHVQSAYQAARQPWSHSIVFSKVYNSIPLLWTVAASMMINVNQTATLGFEKPQCYQWDVLLDISKRLTAVCTVLSIASCPITTLRTLPVLMTESGCIHGCTTCCSGSGIHTICGTMYKFQQIW